MLTLEFTYPPPLIPSLARLLSSHTVMNSFALRRRLITSLHGNGIFLMNIRRNERNGVNFEMFAVSLDDMLVLNHQSLFEAVQVR
jgi:hypothetical protein